MSCATLIPFTALSLLPPPLPQTGSSVFFADGDDRNFNKKFKNKAAGRKVRRKQEREEKKKHRAPTLSKIEILARQQHMAPATPNKNGGAGNTKDKDSGSSKKSSNKKQKLESHLEVDMNEHEGETLVTSMGSKSSKKDSKKPTSSSNIADMDARRLEKLQKSNPAFYAMLQEDGVVAGGGPGLEDAMDEDEQYIRHYEKKLGIKRKDAGKLSAKKSFLDDGLGDLLEGIELGSRGKGVARAKQAVLAPASSRASAASASKSSLAVSENKRKAREIESDDEDEDEDEGDAGSFDEELEGFDSEDMESFDEELEGAGSDEEDSFDEELEGVDPEDMTDSELNEDEGDDELLGSDVEGMESFDEELEGLGSESEDDLSDDDEEGISEDDQESGSEDEGKKSEEDAPAKKAEAPAAVQTGKYLPPHLRAAAAAAAAAASESSASSMAKAIPRQNTEELIRLRRQLQGLLNKLSESNIESILMDVEALYRKYPRAGTVAQSRSRLLFPMQQLFKRPNSLSSFLCK